MDRDEARAVAASVLEECRPVSFAGLAMLVDQSVWANRTGPRGTAYAVKVYGLWDAGVIGGDLRVVAVAMDGTKTRFRGLRSAGVDVIVTPGGRFLDE